MAHPHRDIRTRSLQAVAALALAATAAGCASSGSASSAPFATVSSASASATSNARTDQAFAHLESEYDARLGLWALDTGTGRAIGWRADDRIAYASTFKALAVGVLLTRYTPAQLNQIVVHYTETDMVDYSPVTSRHIATGMTLYAVCDAALRYSDNTAANLLFRQLGGPSAVQAALRSLGDKTTDVDRTEPTLNSAVPGDTRDTSTPTALATDLRTFLLGDALPGAGRTLLENWMLANTTGGDLIRAGVPAGSRVADKTGNGDYGVRNDIAVVWPAHGAPIVIAVMSTRTTANATYNDALIAQATKVAVGALSG